jgi:hypothetical protein
MKGKALITVELNPNQYELIKIKKIDLRKDTFNYKGRTFTIKPELFIYRKKNTFYYLYEIDNPNPIYNFKQIPTQINTLELDNLVSIRLFRNLVGKFGLFNVENIIFIILGIVIGAFIGYMIGISQHPQQITKLILDLL